MTNSAISNFHLRLRTAGLAIAALLLSNCGGGADHAAQHGTVSSNFPLPRSTVTLPFTPTVGANQAAITLSRVIANPGATLTIEATLMTAGEQIAAAQIDISVPPGARVAARSDGRPDCWVNPDINKGSSSFVLLPNFCVDVACTGLRAIVLATDNTDVIADRSVLFRCTVNIDFDATATLTLTTSQVIMSDPTGQRIDAAGIDGVITVDGSPLATPTPTVTVDPPAVILDRITAHPGTTVDLNAVLTTRGALISATQFDVDFAPQARISAKSTGQPFCFVNPDINKNGTSFAFRPLGCLGADCTTLRAVVVSLDTVDPIADGAVLITCRVSIARDAAGSFPLMLSDVILSDPNGARVDAASVDGSITVSGALLPTETPTPTSPPGPSATVTATAAPIGTVTHPSVVLSRVSAAAGSIVDFAATLALPNDERIVATQNDITFPPGVRISATANRKPDCRVNPDISKESTSFTFHPPLCAGADCTGMRALVLSLSSLHPISNGAVLYTCKLEIASPAEGTLPLRVTGVVMSDPDGNPVPNAEGIDGLITVTAP